MIAHDCHIDIIASFFVNEASERGDGWFIEEKLFFLYLFLIIFEPLHDWVDIVKLQRFIAVQQQITILVMLLHSQKNINALCLYLQLAFRTIGQVEDRVEALFHHPKAKVYLRIIGNQDASDEFNADLLALYSLNK